MITVWRTRQTLPIKVAGADFIGDKGREQDVNRLQSS